MQKRLESTLRVPSQVLQLAVSTSVLCCMRLSYVAGQRNLDVYKIIIIKLINGSNIITDYDSVKGTQMGPLLVLVCPCFSENVIVTCKIVSFCEIEIIFF